MLTALAAARRLSVRACGLVAADLISVAPSGSSGCSVRSSAGMRTTCRLPTAGR
jgi:hypothetical protein